MTIFRSEYLSSYQQGTHAFYKRLRESYRIMSIKTLGNRR